ncbi:OmpA family protein [uncultured Thiodictyon sp.]|uniref:OmpA family protein n=1 Tax=uncultured Thiodictyon sp. TaxID=1846217 RepID=UPI0025D100A4|nr:OmpA family protein [uncultured Thiodictyon sp.]
MNAHPLLHARWPLATPPKHPRGLTTLGVGCAALLLAVLAAGPSPAVAAEPAAGQPAAGTTPAKSKPKAAAAKSKPKADAAKNKTETAKSKAKSKTKSENGKSKAPAEPAKTTTTEAAKRRARRPSVGRAANPAPVASALPAAAAGQPAAAAPPTVFEHGPGVLGISLRTLRQQQIKEYVTEPVALVALALDDLRLAPVNKGTHVEINLGQRIPFDGKGDKVPPKSRRLLDVIARILNDNPQTQLQVLVHTDNTGNAPSNLQQSQRAAEAVRAYLMTKGVVGERITAIGRGGEAPLAAAVGKRKPARPERNRRVELIVEPLRPAPTTPTDAVPPPGPTSPTDQPPPGPTNPTDQPPPPTPATPTAGPVGEFKPTEGPR